MFLGRYKHMDQNIFYKLYSMTTTRLASTWTGLPTRKIVTSYVLRSRPWVRTSLCSTQYYSAAPAAATTAAATEQPMHAAVSWQTKSVWTTWWVHFCDPLNIIRSVLQYYSHLTNCEMKLDDIGIIVKIDCKFQCLPQLKLNQLWGSIICIPICYNQF